MDNFPIEKLKFTHAKLSGTDGSLSIEIGIEPFELSQDEYTENVDSSIRLDGINLPKNVSHLPEQSFYLVGDINEAIEKAKGLQA